MRQDTLWQGERREARLHWWRQVLERPATAVKREEVFDEALSMRFRGAVDTDFGGSRETASGTLSWA